MRTLPPPYLRPALALASLLALGCGDEATAPDCLAARAIVLEPGGQITFVRLMDVLVLDMQVVSECDSALPVSADETTWTSSAPAVASVEPARGAQGPVGVIRAHSFGTATVSVEARGVGTELTVEVRQPDTETSGFTVLGSGAVAPSTTDLWIHGEHAYTGSGPWQCPGGSCQGVPGWLFVWRLSPGGSIEKVDSVALPAARVNDVKVSADGAFAVASLELGGADNGIVLLDLSDPAAPFVRTHYTDDLDHGVHNVWIERIGESDYVFVAVPSGTHAGVHVVDVTDRDTPREVASFYGGSSIVHDVYVRDGLAFISHWDAGLVIVDVGNGIAGGSPEAPVEVSRVATEGGNVHNAWYWPEGEVVFVGEEQFAPPELALEEAGVMHVVDVSDMAAPVEVAWFGVPGVTPHNFWLDEDRGVLFAAWYEKGLRAVDVTGGLSGDLAAQGRELGYVLPAGERGAPSIWAPQLHDGRIYLSDIYNGLWSVRFEH